MSEAAKHRSRDCAQHYARAKSQPGLGTGGNDKGQNDHAKDGNRTGVHDRSPADRTLLNGRVWQSSPAATSDCPNHRAIMEPRGAVYSVSSSALKVGATPNAGDCAAPCRLQ